jgi:hypothetical protein
MRPHRGTLVLILGILGLTFCVAFGIAAWVMGNSDLEEMAAGRMDPAGRDLTQAGRLCGIVNVALFALSLVALGFLAVLAIVIAGAAAR